jgi:hypothetical protein
MMLRKSSKRAKLAPHLTPSFRLFFSQEQASQYRLQATSCGSHAQIRKRMALPIKRYGNPNILGSTGFYLALVCASFEQRFAMSLTGICSRCKSTNASLLSTVDMAKAERASAVGIA